MKTLFFLLIPFLFHAPERVLETPAAVQDAVTCPCTTDIVVDDSACTGCTLSFSIIRIHKYTGVPTTIWNTTTPGTYDDEINLWGTWEHAITINLVSGSGTVSGSVNACGDIIDIEDSTAGNGGPISDNWEADCN